MAASNGDSRSALDDPFRAPAIGLTDHIDADDSPIDGSSKKVSASDQNWDASRFNGKGQHPDGSDDDEDGWNDEEDDNEYGDDNDDELALYENWLDGAEKHWKLNQIVESQNLRKRLRLIGQDRFIKETLESGRFTAKQLCTALGARIPFFLEDAPDEAYYTLLSICIARELQKRVKLSQWNTLDDAAGLLKKAKNIIVLTGAGISTSLGIPDFRSKDTGLYSRLEHLGLSDPQEVFDINLFREDPSIFYSVAKDILPPSTKYTPTHRFICMLQEKNKLLTNYTQNIDNLEQAAGISKSNLIQCHGSFATATCIQCNYKVPGTVIHTDLRAGKVAYCEKCSERIRKMQKPGVKRKRSSDDANLKSKKKKKKDYDSDFTDDEDEDDIIVPGVMKPDITFFGENLPPTFHDRLIKHDLAVVDLVLVIGTSLKVAPVSEVVGVIPPKVPQIYISKEPCNHAEFDIDLLGDCDTVMEALCRRAGWSLAHTMTYDGTINVSKMEGYQSRFKIDRVMNGAEELDTMHDAHNVVEAKAPFVPIVSDNVILQLQPPARGLINDAVEAQAGAPEVPIHGEANNVQPQVEALFDAPGQAEDELEEIEATPSPRIRDVGNGASKNPQEATKHEFNPERLRLGRVSAKNARHSETVYSDDRDDASRQNAIDEADIKKRRGYVKDSEATSITEAAFSLEQPYGEHEPEHPTQNESPSVVKKTVHKQLQSTKQEAERNDEEEWEDVSSEG